MSKIMRKMIMGILVCLSVGQIVGCSNEEIVTTNKQIVQDEEKQEITNDEVEEESETRVQEVPKLPVDTEAVLKFGHAPLHEDVDYIIEAFNEIYPNIVIETEQSPSRALWEQNDFLMTKAASGDLPDIFVGFPSLPLVVSQGWAYPLNELVSQDEEFKYVPEANLRALQLGNDSTLYAVPYEMSLQFIGVNMDLLEEMNLDAPEFSWTFPEFIELAKAATTNETSGIQKSSIENELFGILGGQNDLGKYCFNEVSGKVNLTDGTFTKGLGYLKELKSIKGLIAEDLKDKAKRDAGELDDYQKKFGKDADPLEEGKILMASWGTWDWSWVKELEGEWELYPFPAAAEGEKSRQAIHSTYGIMSASTKEKEAAFEFLKFFTFGVDGNLIRLESHLNNVYEEGDQEGELERTFNVPTNRHPEIAEKFLAIDYIPEGVKYVYENLGTEEFDVYRGDWERDIPGIAEVVKEYLSPVIKQVLNGEVTAEAIAKEVEDKMNVSLEQYNKEFEQQRDEVYAGFETLRNEIESK